MSIHSPFASWADRVTKSALVHDEATLANSTLNRQQSDDFIILLRDTSRLLSLVNTMPKDVAHGEIPKLDNNQISTSGASALSTAKRYLVTESNVQYDMVKYRSAFDWSTDFEEDNLSRMGIRDVLVNLFRTRMAIDLELAAINSDASLPVGDGQTAANNLYGVNDGFHKILLNSVPAGQIVDAVGTRPSSDLYHAMLRKIPPRYRVNQPNYRFFVPPTTWDAWPREWAARLTTGGDSVLASGSAPSPWGIPITEILNMPQDLTVTATGSTTGSYIWLTDPSNLLFLPRREFKIEFERKPRADLYEATIHYRCDFQVMDPAAVVIAKNVDAISGVADYTL